MIMLKWDKLDRGRYSKGNKLRFTQLKYSTAKKEIEDNLRRLGDTNRPLSWYKLGRLLGMRELTSVYSWKHLRTRPSAYRWSQMNTLIKLKFDHNFDFTKVSFIDWEQNLINITDDNYVVDIPGFTKTEKVITYV